MLFGLILLLGATIFLCFSTTLPMLVIGRLLQGFSTAVTWTVGLALLIDSVDPKNVGQATGWTATAQSVGVFSGPVLGGLVYHSGGYYPVFAMCFAVIVVDIVLRLLIIELKEAKKWRAVDESPESSPRTLMGDEPIPGASTDTDDASTQLPPAGSADPEKALSKDIVTSKVLVEPTRNFALTGPQGMLSLLTKTRLLASLLGTAVEAMIQTGFESTLPLFVAQTFGWNSTGAGLIFLPLVIPTFLGPAVGALGDRYGPKWLCTGGFLFSTPFLISLRFVTENTITHKVMLCALLAGIGLGLTFVFTPLVAEISWAVEDGAEEGAAKPYAQAYGLYNVAFSGGAIVGPLMGGMIRDHADFGTVGWSFAIITFITAIVQFFWIGGSPFEKKRKQSTSSENTLVTESSIEIGDAKKQ